MCIVSKDCPEPCCKTSVSKLTYFEKNCQATTDDVYAYYLKDQAMKARWNERFSSNWDTSPQAFTKNVQGSLSILGALSIPIHCFLANAPLMHRSGCHCSHSRCLKDANTQCKSTQIQLQIQITRCAIVHCRKRNLLGRANWWGEFCVMWRARPILMPKQFRW